MNLNPARITPQHYVILGNGYSVFVPLDRDSNNTQHLSAIVTHSCRMYSGQPPSLRKGKLTDVGFSSIALQLL